MIPSLATLHSFSGNIFGPDEDATLKTGATNAPILNPLTNHKEPESDDDATGFNSVVTVDQRFSEHAPAEDISHMGGTYSGNAAIAQRMYSTLADTRAQHLADPNSPAASTHSQQPSAPQYISSSHIQQQLVLKNASLNPQSPAEHISQSSNSRQVGSIRSGSVPEANNSQNIFKVGRESTSFLAPEHASISYTLSSTRNNFGHRALPETYKGGSLLNEPLSSAPESNGLGGKAHFQNVQQQSNDALPASENGPLNKRKQSPSLAEAQLSQKLQSSLGPQNGQSTELEIQTGATTEPLSKPLPNKTIHLDIIGPARNNEYRQNVNTHSMIDTGNTNNPREVLFIKKDEEKGTLASSSAELAPMNKTDQPAAVGKEVPQSQTEVGGSGESIQLLGGEQRLDSLSLEKRAGNETSGTFSGTTGSNHNLNATTAVPFSKSQVTVIPSERDYSLKDLVSLVGENKDRSTSAGGTHSGHPIAAYFGNAFESTLQRKNGTFEVALAVKKATPQARHSADNIDGNEHQPIMNTEQLSSGQNNPLVPTTAPRQSTLQKQIDMSHHNNLPLTVTPKFGENNSDKSAPPSAPSTQITIQNAAIHPTSIGSQNYSKDGVVSSPEARTNIPIVAQMVLQSTTSSSISSKIVRDKMNTAHFVHPSSQEGSVALSSSVSLPSQSKSGSVLSQVSRQSSLNSLPSTASYASSLFGEHELGNSKIQRADSIGDNMSFRATSSPIESPAGTKQTKVPVNIKDVPKISQKKFVSESDSKNPISESTPEMIAQPNESDSESSHGLTSSGDNGLDPSAAPVSQNGEDVSDEEGVLNYFHPLSPSNNL